MKALLFILILTFSLANDLNSQWQQTSGTPQGAGVTDMVALSDGTIIVTTASHNWPNGQPGGIRRSTDGGISWQNIMNIYNARTLHLGSTGKLFASCWNYPQNEGMFFSTNNGLNWTQTFFGAANDNVFSIAAKNGDSMVYVGTRNGVFRSFNNGSWVQLTNGLPANTFVYDLDIDKVSNTIAAGTSKGLYISTNHGNVWTAVSGVTQNDTVCTVKFYYSPADNPDDKFFAGTTDGKCYGGTRTTGYHVVQLLNVFFGRVSDIESVEDLYFLPACIFGFGFDGASNSGYFYSTNGGANWIENNSGLPSEPKTSSLACHTQGGAYTMYTGFFENTSNGAKIYKYSAVIGIEQVSTEIPDRFSLSQNYPNPFNPATNIEFTLPKASFVQLVIYDMLGRAVEIIVDKHLKSGTYKADWNAVKYSSGVYFYKLFTDSFSETKKMILTK